MRPRHSKNMLKFNDNYLEFTRKGPMSVHMIFEKGKKKPDILLYTVWKYPDRY